MTRSFNFSAGPAALPLPVLEQVREELLDWRSCGASVMEVSHRSQEFIDLAESSISDLAALLEIPDSYQVLFLQGGAQMQFSMVPLNLLGERSSSADYINTGHWSTLAIREARRYTHVNIVASGEGNGFVSIPPRVDWRLGHEAAYVHYTPNETIQGLEFHEIPEVGSVPLVADMSSTILSRPLDISKFGLIYAGAQKNIGPAGITVVIVRKDLLGLTSAAAPKLFNYEEQGKKGSMMNTVPTFSWYVASLVFKWLRELGGLSVMSEINQRKAAKLYGCIDQSGGFYRNPVSLADRSWMNVPFFVQNAELESLFLRQCEESSLVGLKGHRAVGGMRASLYNAVTEHSVDMLIQFMQEFQRTHG